ncbi:MULTISPECIES: hypothetical protein [Halorussus]|uniref:hypothetical protein n=1 Tax=Halorussus TaxID=1070314 RepID=UPI000E20FB7F|nr:MULTISPECIES: hypothetical protein [Halorussus]NHN61168.1 hypothetical protein [Halorussus sp. JP-T4]
MNRGAVVAVVLLFSLAAGGVLLAGDDGLGGTPDAPAGDSTTTTTTGSGGSPTDTASGDSASDATATPSDSGYAFTIQSIEDCGSTCRDVTARLDNSGGAVREEVEVTTKMYADDDLLWAGNETVGRLGPGESHTSTRRVDVGFSGGLAISANDGYVTIVTVVRSEGGTARFSERRKVA